MTAATLSYFHDMFVELDSVYLLEKSGWTYSTAWRFTAVSANRCSCLLRLGFWVTSQHSMLCAVRAIPPCHTSLCFARFAFFLLTCMQCTLPTLVKCAHARDGEKATWYLCLDPYHCLHVVTHMSLCVCVIQACWLQQCKRLERKRARQASGSLSDTDKAAPTAGEPGYLSKLRRSISSLRSSRRYFDSV